MPNRLELIDSIPHPVSISCNIYPRNILLPKSLFIWSYYICKNNSNGINQQDLAPSPQSYSRIFYRLAATRSKNTQSFLRVCRAFPVTQPKYSSNSSPERSVIVKTAYHQVQSDFSLKKSRPHISVFFYHPIEHHKSLTGPQF